MYCYIIIIIIIVLYYYILKKYGNKEIKSIDIKSIDIKMIENIKSIDTKSIKNNIPLKLQPPPSYEDVIKDTKKSKYKLCPFFTSL